MPSHHDLRVAQAEREHAEGVAELAEQVVDPRVIGGDGVQRALVERAAGARARGTTSVSDELEVAADLVGEAGEPVLERLVPCGDRRLVRRRQGGAQLAALVVEERPPHEIGDRLGAAGESVRRSAGEIGHVRRPIGEHERVLTSSRADGPEMSARRSPRRPRPRVGASAYGTRAAWKKARTWSRRCSRAPRVERVDVEQPAEERGVGEVAEQGAVPGDQQLLGVLLAERARRPSPGGSSRRRGRTSAAARRPGRCRGGAAVDRLPAHEADVGRVVGEVTRSRRAARARPCSQPCSSEATAASSAAEPVRQQALEHLAVQRLLRREVVQQAGPADADAGGDVVERRALVAGGREARDGLVEDRLARRADRRTGVGAWPTVDDGLVGPCPQAIAAPYRPVGSRCYPRARCCRRSSSPWSSASASRSSPTSATTVYLHRALAHRALTPEPGRSPRCSGS